MHALDAIYVALQANNKEEVRKLQADISQRIGASNFVLAKELDEHRAERRKGIRAPTL